MELQDTLSGLVLLTASDLGNVEGEPAFPTTVVSREIHGRLPYKYGRLRVPGLGHECVEELLPCEHSVVDVDH